MQYILNSDGSVSRQKKKKNETPTATQKSNNKMTGTEALATVGKTIGNVATNMGTGALRTMESTADFVSDKVANPTERKLNYYYDYLTKGKKVANENLKDLIEMQERDIKKDRTSKFLEDVGYNDVVDKWEQGSLVNRNNFGGKVAQGVGGMVPSLVVGGAAGSKAALTDLSKLSGKQKALAALGNVGKTYKAQLPANLMLGASSYGSGMEEALNEGATMEQARKFGLANALIEQGTEMITGGVPGLGGKGGIDGLIDPLIDKGSKGFTKAALKSLYRMGGEGLEEAAAEMLNPLAKKTYSDEPIDWGQTIKNAWEAAKIGAVTGAALGGSQTVGDFQRAQLENNMRKLPNLNDVERNALVELTIKRKSGQPLTEEDLGTIQYLNQKTSQIQEAQTAQQQPIREAQVAQQSQPIQEAQTTQQAQPVQETTEQVEEKPRNVGIHYGDLGKAKDTYYSNVSGSRGTGHLGTGTYFVSENYKPSETSTYAKRPSNEVSFDDYNLYKPSTDREGYDLHDGLKAINSKSLFNKEQVGNIQEKYNTYLKDLSEKSVNDLINTLDEQGYDVDNIKKDFEEGWSTRAENNLRDMAEDIINDYDRLYKSYNNMVEQIKKNNPNISDKAINKAFEKTNKTLESYKKKGYKYGQYPTPDVDSLSTVFMKNLGYEGVDVRHLKGLDDTTYGSVIYDLKNKEKETTKQGESKINQQESTQKKKFNNELADFINSETDSNKAEMSDFFKDRTTDYDKNQGYSADGKSNVFRFKKGNNEAKLSITENENEIWIDELYIKNQKQGYGKEIVDAIKKYAYEKGKEIRTFKEVGSARKFWDKMFGEETDTGGFSHRYIKHKPEYWQKRIEDAQESIERFSKWKENALEQGNEGLANSHQEGIDWANKMLEEYKTELKKSQQDVKTNQKETAVEKIFKNIKTKEDMDSLISNLKNKVDNIKTGDDLKNTFKEIYDIYKVYNKSNDVYEVVEKDGQYGTKFESEFYNPEIKYKPLNEEIKIQKENLRNWLSYMQKDTDKIIYDNQDKVTPTIGKNIKSLNEATPITTDDFKNKLHDYIDKETKEIRGKFESKDGRLYRGGNEIKYLYRAIDQAEMDSIKSNGYIKSNQSKNIGYEIEQGLTDFKDNYPGFYLPRNADGYIIKIKIKPENGFFYDTDEYAKTPNKIPSNQIVEINGENVGNSQQEYDEKLPDKNVTFEDINFEENGNEGAKPVEVLGEMPKKERLSITQKAKKYANEVKESGSFLRRKFVDKLQSVDMLDRENNRKDNLYAEADRTHRSVAEAQYSIGDEQIDTDGNEYKNFTDKSGKKVSKSLIGIFDEVEKYGMNMKEFNEYLIDYLNLDRYDKVTEDGKSKAPRGLNYTKEMSEENIKKFEEKHPEAKRIAENVWQYSYNELDNRVKNGVMTKKQAENYKKETPHYVPISRDVEGYQSTMKKIDNRLVVNNQNKKIKGDSTAPILPIREAMAWNTVLNRSSQRINNAIKAVAQRYDAQDTNLSYSDSDLNINQDNVAVKSKDGKYYLTYFDGGKAKTFQVDKGMYEAFLPDQVYEWEKFFKIPATVDSFRKKLITDYNIKFLKNNAIKDVQDAMINTQYPKEFLGKYMDVATRLKNKNPDAKMQQYINEFKKSGGFSETYFADREFTSQKTKNPAKKALQMLNRANEYIELTPRLTEYILSREHGESVSVALHNAADVTTNFARGGVWAKKMNKWGFTFLNPSIQGADKAIRNLDPRNPRRFASVVARGALLGIGCGALNEALWNSGIFDKMPWGDDDDDDDGKKEYENLNEYIKNNYYIIPDKNGKPNIRIPKGRMMSVLQSIGRRGYKTAKGDGKFTENFKDLPSYAWGQVGPADPGNNNVFAPLIQAARNKSWSGNPIDSEYEVKNVAPEERYSVKTTSMAKKLGKALNISPKRIDYVFDQYSGAIGDLVIPMTNQYAETSSDNKFLEGLGAVFGNDMNLDPTFSNKQLGELYDNSNKYNTLTKEEKKKYKNEIGNKYLNEKIGEISEYNQQIKDIQASKKSNKEKMKETKELQKKINEIAEDANKTYKNVKKEGKYAATVGDSVYAKDNYGKWKKESDKTKEKRQSLGLDIEDYYYYKKEEAYTKPDGYQTSLVDGDKAKDKIALVDVFDFDPSDYLEYSYKINKIKAGKDTQRQVIEYIDSLPISAVQKAALYKKKYRSYKDYDRTIYNYIDNSDLTVQEKESLANFLKIK